MVLWVKVSGRTGALAAVGSLTDGVDRACPVEGEQSSRCLAVVAKAAEVKVDGVVFVL